MRVLLIVYDNGSYISWFPQGLAYIAAVLLRAGHKVTVYNDGMHHYPAGHLHRYLEEHEFDIVCVSFVAGYYQYRKVMEISAAVNAAAHRPFYIIGGHGPTPEPEYFLRVTGADAVVMGEGEITIIRLLDALDAGEPLCSVKGIAFRDGDDVVVNERRPLIEDVDSIPFPAYELFPMEYYRLLREPGCGDTDFVLPMLSGRGCTFKCNFCYRMDEGFRPRGSAGIIEEVEYLKANYGATYIVFSDELLMSSRRRVIELCGEFIRRRVGIKWSCNGRLNYADEDVLDIMKRAGCVFINYGIESFDDQALKNMNKGLTTRQITRGVEATLAAGISPGLNIIWGNIGENRETLRKSTEFLLRYDDGAQLRTIRPVTPYPGSALYYYAIDQGLLKDCEDFYKNKHVNSDLLAVNFTGMPDEEFHRSLHEANTRLIENYLSNKAESYKATMRKLYVDLDSDFRGFRPV